MSHRFPITPQTSYLNPRDCIVTVASCWNRLSLIHIHTVRFSVPHNALYFTLEHQRLGQRFPIGIVCHPLISIHTVPRMCRSTLSHRCVVPQNASAIVPMNASDLRLETQRLATEASFATVCHSLIFTHCSTDSLFPSTPQASYPNRRDW